MTPLGFLLLTVVAAALLLAGRCDGAPLFRPDPVDDEESDYAADRWERGQRGDR